VALFLAKLYSKCGIKSLVENKSTGVNSLKLTDVYPNLTIGMAIKDGDSKGGKFCEKITNYLLD
jgi:hypothetical protein